MTFIDTHCHLQDAKFAREEAEAAIERAREASIEMVLCGYDAPSNAAALKLVDGADGVFPTVGFHPHEAADVTPAMLAELESLARLPDVVAVGEIGLDFYRDLSPRDAQYALLDEQLAIAVRTGKPVSVHTRGAEDESLGPLTAYSKAKGWKPGEPPVGVMHCFGGTVEQARRYVAIGFMVSIACTITYPRNEDVRRLAAELPLDVLVAETDSPYLPPQFMRGRRNEPFFVRSAVEAIAAARGITPDDAAAGTTANARKLFGLPIGKVAACS